MNQKTIPERIQNAYENDQAALCITLAELWLGEHPDDLSVVEDYAEMLYVVGRYDDAIRLYSETIDRFPDVRWIYCCQLGHLHRYRGTLAEAEHWYQQAIDCQPAAASGYVYRGAVEARQGNLSQAEQTLRLGIERTDGCNDEVYHNLGLVLRGQNRLVEAKACFEKAIEIDENYQEAIDALSDVAAAISIQSEG